MKNLVLAKSAKKDLKKLDKQKQQEIVKKLRFYISQEQILLFASALSNSEIGNYRFRIGDYRAVFDIRGQEVVILRIGHRREVYR